MPSRLDNAATALTEGPASHGGQLQDGQLSSGQVADGQGCTSTAGQIPGQAGISGSSMAGHDGAGPAAGRKILSTSRASTAHAGAAPGTLRSMQRATIAIGGRP